MRPYNADFVAPLLETVVVIFDLLTLESCHVMAFGWPIPAPSLNWIWLTVQELRRLKFSF